jgi:hypothetical protein
LSGYPVDWAELRETALRRDGYHCGNCGSIVGLNVHHVVPLGYGGSNRLDNLRTLCWECHQRSHGKFGKVVPAGRRRPAKRFSFSGPALLSGMLLTLIGIWWLSSLPRGQSSPADPFLVLGGATFGTIVVEAVYRSVRLPVSSQVSAISLVRNVSQPVPPRRNASYTFSVAMTPGKQSSLRQGNAGWYYPEESHKQA